MDTQQVIEKLEQLGIYISEQGQSSVEWAWPILVRQQIFEGVLCLIGALFLIALFAFFAKLMISMIKQDIETAPLMMIPMSIVFLAIGACANGAMQLFNPQYYALMEVLNKFN